MPTRPAMLRGLLTWDDADAPLIHVYAYDRTRHGRVQARKGTQL